MAYQDFINDFKKEIIGDTLCFYGAENFLMEWAVEQIVKKYIDDSSRNIDFQRMDGELVSSSDIMSASRSYSMFSDKRVIVVKNFLPLFKSSMDSDLDELITFCSNKNDSSILIFQIDSKHETEINSYGKKLIKACNSYEFARLDKAALKAFINKRVHEAEKLLGNREMEFLIDLSGYYNKSSGYSLADFDRDIYKITAACENEQIDSGLIESVLIGEEDKFVFNLVDALMAGKKDIAMSIAETVISEDDGSMAVLSLLTKQFEIMYDSLELSKQGLSIADMAKRTGINEFRFKKAYQAARNFSTKKLREVLIKIYNIDKDIKIGNIDKDTAFELLIISI